MKRCEFKMLTIAAMLAAASMAFGCGDGNESVTDTNDDILDSEGVIQDANGSDGIDTDATRDDTVVPGKVRFLFVSDIHYRVEDGETRNNDYMTTRVGLINAIDGDFDMLVSGGDNYDHILPQWEDDPLASPMTWYVEEMDKLKMPWMAAIGNHEYYDFFGDRPTMTTDGEKRQQTFATVMGHDPLYFVREVGGVKLIALNSNEENAWSDSYGLMGKFSTEQLDWLRGQLAEGKPTFLFMHHPPSSFAPVSESGLLCDVISEYPDVVKSIFGGHTHGFWKGNYCDTPYYVVEDFHGDENLWYEVEYDIPSDTVTILNEDKISFPEVPEFTCEPGESTVNAPYSIVGTVQKMTIAEGVSDATGLGEMLGEMMGAIPFVLSFDGYSDEIGYYSRMTIASRWEIDNFLTYVDGSPCVDLNLRHDGGSPCFEGGPVSMQVQVMPFLAAVSDDPVNPDWSAILDIRNFVVEGRMGNDANGDPVIADGIVSATLMRDATLKDMKTILVSEYCKGNTDGCVPGEGKLPACPATLDDAAIETVYTGIQYETCDLQVMGFGLKMIIDMVATLPDETHVTGKISSEVLVPSATIEGGGQVVDNLFSTEAGMNCYAQ